MQTRYGKINKPLEVSCLRLAAGHRGVNTVLRGQHCYQATLRLVGSLSTIIATKLSITMKVEPRRETRILEFGKTERSKSTPLGEGGRHKGKIGGNRRKIGERGKGRGSMC